MSNGTSAAETVPGTSTGRRRRANVPGGRQHSHRVMVSPEEEARLVVLAEAQHVTVPRLLVESTLSGQAETPTQRHHAMADLFGLQRLLAGLSGDLERVESDAEVPSLLAAVRDLVGRIDDAIDGLSPA